MVLNFESTVDLIIYTYYKKYGINKMDTWSSANSSIL